jgi:SAM-dependent methyltransferase
MLLNKQEYQAMFEVEDQLWWYKILHKKVIDNILIKFETTKEISILDAGCGTGGLLLNLQKAGFNNIFGFDFNQNAVDFTNSRGFKVMQQDITKLEGMYLPNTFDVIICNDVLYQFEENEIIAIIKNLAFFLKSNGIIISNNNAFEVFRGTHDIAVGSKKRFTKTDFKSYIENQNLQISFSTYWSFLLSPIILSVRLIQKLQLKLGLINIEKITSDLAMPSVLLNKIFFNIVKIEEKVSNYFPFGSSLFLVLEKK